MKCQIFRAEIEESDGDAPLGAGAAAHAESCPSCRAFRLERVALRRLVGELEPVAAPADFEFRLRARMAAAGRAPRAPRFHLTPRFASAALAVCLGLTVGGTVYFRQQPHAAPEPAATGGLGGGAVRQTRDETTGRVAAGRVEAEPAPTGDGVAGGFVADDVTAATTEGTGHVAGVQKVAGLERVAGRPARARSSARAKGPEVIIPENTATFGNRGATVYAASGGRPSGQTAISYSTIAVPVRLSPQPIQVVLRDESGAARVLSMKRVSFGAQEAVARAGKTPAPLSDEEGAW